MATASLAHRITRLERENPAAAPLERMTNAELDAHIHDLLALLTDDELEGLAECDGVELYRQAPADLVRAWIEQAGRQPRALSSANLSHRTSTLG